MNHSHARRVHFAPDSLQLHWLQPSFHVAPTACSFPSVSPHPFGGDALVAGCALGDALTSFGALGPPHAASTSTKAQEMKLFDMRTTYPRC